MMFKNNMRYIKHERRTEGNILGGKFTFKHPHVGVMSASGLKNRYLIVSLHHQQQFGIYPQTKVALWQLQDPAP